MNLMASRYQHLLYTFEGFKRTGVSLIEYNGINFAPSFTGDDIGIYVLIPKLAQLLSISFDQAINLFFGGTLFISCFIGLVGVWFLYHSWTERLIGTVTLVLLTRFSWAVGDVYIAYASCSMVLIPWFLFCIHHRQPQRLITIFFFFAGIVIGFSHYIRAYSALGVLLFMLIVLMLNRDFSWYKKGVQLLLLIAGFAVPYAYFSKVYNNHVQYAQEYFPNVVIGQKNHVFWHSIYLGFGFLNFRNKDNIVYDDAYGFNKVAHIDNTVTLAQTDKYEQVLKQEVFKLIKEQTYFVIITLSAKIGVLLMYLIKFANVGLFAAWYYRKRFLYDCAWFVALALNAAFPLLVMPMHEYALGFISLAALYAMTSINVALEQGFLVDCKNLVSIHVQRAKQILFGWRL